MIIYIVRDKIILYKFIYKVDILFMKIGFKSWDLCDDDFINVKIILYYQSFYTKKEQILIFTDFLLNLIILNIFMLSHFNIYFNINIENINSILYTPLY